MFPVLEPSLDRKILEYCRQHKINEEQFADLAEISLASLKNCIQRARGQAHTRKPQSATRGNILYALTIKDPLARLSKIKATAKIICINSPEDRQVGDLIRQLASQEGEITFGQLVNKLRRRLQQR